MAADDTMDRIVVSERLACLEDRECYNITKRSIQSLIKPHGHQRMRAALEQVIGLRYADAAAFRDLLEADDLVHACSELLELSEL